MDFIFSTGSLWSYGIERCFELAARAGFDGIELMVDQRWDTRQPDHLRRLSDQHHLPVLAVHSPFAPYVPGWPSDEPGRIQATVKLAQALSARIVVHHLPIRVGWIWMQVGQKSLPLPVPGWDRGTSYCRWLECDYAALQESVGLTLCIENMPTKQILGRRWQLHHWNTPEEIVRFPSLTMDTTHLGTWGLEPVDVYPRLNGQVRHIHLSNFDGKEHRRPEAGHLHLDRFLALLARDSYRGVVSLEMQPDALDAGQSDERVVALMAVSLAQCRAWASKP